MAKWIKDPNTGEDRYVCGHKKRRTKEICLSYPLKGKDYCRHHHTERKIGVESPAYVHGKYSKVLRRDLLYAYGQSLAIEDPYSMRDELGLIDARLNVLAKALDLSDGAGLLDKVDDIKSSLSEAEYSGTIIDLHIINEKLDTIMEDVQNERKRWNEIYDVIDQRRRVVESERKREMDAQKMVTEREVLVLIGLLVSIVRKHVQDQSILNAIGAELNELGDWKAGRLIEVQSG